MQLFHYAITTLGDLLTAWYGAEANDSTTRPGPMIYLSITDHPSLALDHAYPFVASELRRPELFPALQTQCLPGLYEDGLTRQEPESVKALDKVRE